MITHADASELLGAYALDAVEPDEVAAIEAHLETCPRCRAELISHREVVGLLAYAGQEAPEGLWDRVVSRINDSEADGDSVYAGGRSAAGPHGAADGEAGPDSATGIRRGPMEPPHSLRLVRVERNQTPKGARTSPRGRRPGWRYFTQATSLVAAAAIVVVALLGVEVVRLQDRTNHLSGQITAMADQPTMADVRQALAVPGARRVVLSSASLPSAPSGTGSGSVAASMDAVILPSGDGYLYDSRLTPLSPAQTYQLWGVVGTQQISYGVLGATPAPVVAFRTSSGVQALAVTAEVAGGVVSSTHLPVVFGRLA